MLKKKLNAYSYLLQKKIKHQLKRIRRNEIVTFKSREDEYDSYDDMPLTLSRDPHPGNRFSDHETSDSH